MAKHAMRTIGMMAYILKTQERPIISATFVTIRAVTALERFLKFSIQYEESNTKKVANNGVMKYACQRTVEYAPKEIRMNTSPTLIRRLMHKFRSLGIRPDCRASSDK